MPSMIRTIGITIACAVVILAANASIYANTPGVKPVSSHQEAHQTTNILHVVVYRDS